MAKFLLDEEDYFDFRLIGISSHVHDYRICWAVNKALGLEMAKSDEEILIQPKRGATPIPFSIFYTFDMDTEVEMELIANRHMEGYLIPEMKTADYFLKFSGWHEESSPELIKKLRKENLVNMAFEVNLDDLKSKQNLVYR